MTVLCSTAKNRFLGPGTLVRLAIRVNEIDMIEPEYGVVAHCWNDNALDSFHCLVAFVGGDPPTGGPIEDPYFSTLAATCLEELQFEDQSWVTLAPQLRRRA